MSFPQPPPTFPVNSSNNDHMLMVPSAKSSSSSSKIKTKNSKCHVGDMDVICGRGKAGFNHPGNIRFRTAVMQAIEDYQHAEDRIGKPVIVRAIISNTYSTGGCFVRRDLKQDNAAWIALNFQEQKDKVRHALRDAIAEMKMKKMKATVQCIREEPAPSTKEGRSSDSFRCATTSNLLGANNPFSIISVLSQNLPSTTAVGTQGNSTNMAVSSSAYSSLIAFPDQPLLQQILQLYDTTSPSSVKDVSLGSIGGRPTMNVGVDTDDINNAAFALQLATQLQLEQMNSREYLNQSIVLKLHQQIQREQQLQNVHNCISNMNAMKLALLQRIAKVPVPVIDIHELSLAYH